MYSLSGEAPSNLIVHVLDRTGAVEVSWVPPSAPPGKGYQITARGPSLYSDNAKASPHVMLIQTPGVYTIQVTSRSQHFPGRSVELQGIDVKGEEPKFYCEPHIRGGLHASCHCMSHNF